MLEIAARDTCFDPALTLDLRKILPHRAPFLFVDRVVSFNKETRNIHTQKFVSQNEPALSGHFEHFPIFPGVYVTEALAQSCGVLLSALQPDHGATRATHEHVVLIESKIRHTGAALPGHIIDLTAHHSRERHGIMEFQVMASVAERTIARGLLCLGNTDEEKLIASMR